MRIRLFAILALALTTGGCITGTRSIELTVPDRSKTTSSIGSVYIGEIRDNRIFVQNPAQASTPSVKGKLEETTPEQRARLIGRQRNTVGKAMGDVALANNSTVQNEVRRLLEAGFAARGYTVSESKDADITVITSINKFWGWFRPGFWRFGFESDIECDIVIDSDKGQKQMAVAGHGLNYGQVASDESWKLSFDRAYADFLKNLESALERTGL